MITQHVGETALPDIEKWANGIIRSEDDTVKALESYHDADSNTYVIRLCRDAPVLLFRLSEAQVHTLEREPEWRENPTEPGEGSAPAAGPDGMNRGIRPGV